MPSFRNPFKRRKATPGAEPDLWVRCPGCSELLFKKTLEKSLRVCAACGHHFRVPARERIAQLVDEGTFVEADASLISLDPIVFTDSKGYPERAAAARATTGERDAAIRGTALIGGIEVSLVAMDFFFMGGSMGSVVGEKVARAAELATARRLPLVIVSASGGARMQEGTYALMQLPKTNLRGWLTRALGLLQPLPAPAVPLYRQIPIPGVGLIGGMVTGVAQGAGAMIGSVLSPVADAATKVANRADQILENQRDRHLAPELGPHLDESEAWSHVQRAREVNRPRTAELLEALGAEFVELRGDRRAGDDGAIVAGIARIDGRRIVVVGTQKGTDTESNIRRGFGMPHPEGYRKAMRAFELAERLHLPLLTLIDTPGAHPGPESEQHGIAEAIAAAISKMTELRTPIVTVVTGEGGSGGALAIAAADRVFAFEHAYYSVISPEGCAAILFRTSEKAPAAARALRITAPEQVALGVVDGIIAEPETLSAESTVTLARAMWEKVSATFDELESMSDLNALLDARYARYRAYGAFDEAAPTKKGLVGTIRSIFGMDRDKVPAGVNDEWLDEIERNSAGA
ncbi:MAG: acetyl-CoA carboxylase carboxyl transferase subunit beta [bacterium]|nr:acetyl-CoA carboxylase carboxyl transferase subunit beta [Candidatus Aquidulcis frankliniae]